MRFMIIVKSTPEFEAETRPAPDAPDVHGRWPPTTRSWRAPACCSTARGLQPSRSGWRIHYGAEGRRVVDGPFAEAKELIAGYTLIQVRSRDEALEWSRRFPNPVGEGREAVIEVRQLYELEDFAPGPSRERFRRLNLPSQNSEDTP